MYLLLSLAALAAPPQAPFSTQACFTEIVTKLSSDKMEGRGVGTKGLDTASRWLAVRIQALGFEPGPRGYYQPFQVITGVTLGGHNSLADTEPLTVGQDFVPMGFSASQRFQGPLVFVGYGIVAPSLGYDDYAGVDVRGKIALAMRYEPGEDDADSPFDGRRPSHWSDLREKAHRAKQAGAVALIFVTPASKEGEADSLPGLRIDGPTSDAGIPVLQVTRAVADRWLASVQTDLASLRQQIDASTSPHSMRVPVLLSGRSELVRTRSDVRNVIGVLPGAGRLAKETVVVGAHYDHLGYGGRGSMRPDEHAIHNGADDNASGVAAAICGARAWTDLPRPEASVRVFGKSMQAPRRTVVLSLFAAEELGLGGSGYYTYHPIRPLDRTVAMVNLDMVGRVHDGTLQALGTDSAPEWEGWLSQAASAAGLTLTMGGSGYGRSDQTSFYAKGIPVVHFFSGSHDQYHTPEDDIELIELAGGAQVSSLLAHTLASLTVGPAPSWQPASSNPLLAGDARGYGAYLGTVPDYSTMMAEQGGVLLSGVRAGGPAEAAGLVAGDRIVGMAGVEVRNLYDMTFVLRDHRPGDSVEITVQRGDTTLTLLATLASRGEAKGGSSHGGDHSGVSPHSGDDWAPSAGKAVSQLLDPRETHLSDLRQLTFGGENAEAYWFPDGHKLIFQRTPEGGGCDQQFVLDLDSGETRQVSSGKGRTTCGYTSWPDPSRILYATTEGSDAACPPAPDRSQGYVWPLYDSYELVWQQGEDPASAKPFLPSPGYDAEATVCMKDGRVVFTSTRDGDIDLYVANADGSGLQQLTDGVGYDGGAFFTTDCSAIVWRASRPTGEALADYKRLLAQGLVRPSTLELYRMNPDGSEVVQLTHNGAANFGPYPTNDNSGVIYASNAGDSPREFDLYLVPWQGGEPERITFMEQFDGFPMFSPDGRWLVFGSNRGGSKPGETNLFVARWMP